MLPTADIVVPAAILELALSTEVTFPLRLNDPADTTPPVVKLPAVMFPVPEIAPPLPLVTKLPPVILPVALISPPVKKLPPVMLPLVDIGFVPNAAKLAATLALP